jgi:hypothetical protein
MHDLAVLLLSSMQRHNYYTPRNVGETCTEDAPLSKLGAYIGQEHTCTLILKSMQCRKWPPTAGALDMRQQTAHNKHTLLAKSSPGSACKQ